MRHVAYCECSACEYARRLKNQTLVGRGVIHVTPSERHTKTIRLGDSTSPEARMLKAALRDIRKANKRTSIRKLAVKFDTSVYPEYRTRYLRHDRRQRMIR